MPEDTRPLLIFPDTNVLVQGRSVHEIPWGEFGERPIELVICGPVIRELDRLKNRGGRAGKVARAMSGTVRELMSAPGKSDVIRAAAPTVVRRLLLGLGIRDAVRAGIDVSHDDQAIINQALARMDAGDDVLLLTDDNFAAMTAEEFGLPVKLLPAAWLREPEADDAGKELARRDAEIARLKSAEPALSLAFADADGRRIERLEATMKRFLPMTEADIDRLMARISTFAPVADVELSTPPRLGPEKPEDESIKHLGPFDLARLASSSGHLERPVTAQEIEKYREAHAEWLSDVRLKMTRLHTDWNRRREWPQAHVVAANSGSRPANDVLLEMEAKGAFRLSGSIADENRPSKHSFSLAFPLPPAPPTPRPARLSSRAILAALGNNQARTAPILPSPFGMPRSRDEDRFYWRSGKSSPTDEMALECKVLRHGRAPEEFSLHIWADDSEPVAGLIVGRVSASNLTTPIEVRLPLRISFEDRDMVSTAEKMVDALERQVRC